MALGFCACVCVGRGGDVRFRSRRETCVLVWGSLGIKWGEEGRWGDLLRVQPIRTPPPSCYTSPSISRLSSPFSPSLSIRGGKVHYMLANQTSITSLEGMKQETRVFLFLPLSAHFCMSSCSSIFTQTLLTLQPCVARGSVAPNTTYMRYDNENMQWQNHFKKQKSINILKNSKNTRSLHLFVVMLDLWKDINAKEKTWLENYGFTP